MGPGTRRWVKSAKASSASPTISSRLSSAAAEPTVRRGEIHKLKLASFRWVLVLASMTLFSFLIPTVGAHAQVRGALGTKCSNNSDCGGGLVCAGLPDRGICEQLAQSLLPEGQPRSPLPVGPEAGGGPFEGHPFEHPGVMRPGENGVPPHYRMHHQYLRKVRSKAPVS
jgi:hypothetical protein